MFRRKKATEPAPNGAREGAAESGAADAARAGAPADADKLRAGVIEALRTVYDPEIPVNIYEIGLVYGIDVSAAGDVHVRMTLTSPMCPVAETLPPEVEAKVAAVTGVRTAKVDVVWDPPWSPAMMSEDAKLLLNIPL